MMHCNCTINHIWEKYLVVLVRQDVKRVRKTFPPDYDLRNTANRSTAPIRLVATGRRFTYCATDFGGPYKTIQGLGETRTRRYICPLFYLETHCCHLEITSSIDVHGFINRFSGAHTQNIFREGLLLLLVPTSLVIVVYKCLIIAHA